MYNLSSNLLLALLVLIISVAGELDEFGNCHETPMELCGLVLNEDSIPWNAPERKKFCKDIQSYYECSKEVPVGDLCGWPLVLNHSKELITELCSRSPLRKSYMRAAECFQYHFRRHIKDCRKATAEVISTYARFSDKGRMLTQDAEAMHCIKETHRMECMAIKVDCRCGKDAYNTFKEILTKSKYYVLYCKNKAQLDAVLSVAAELYEGLLDNRYPRSQIYL